MRRIRQRVTSGRARTPALAALYLVGAAAPRFAAFLLLPVYAFELSPAELAAYGIAVSLAQLLGILSDAGVLDGLGITYFEQRDEDKAGFLKTVVVLSRLVSLVVMVPLALVLAVFWESLFGSGLSLWPGLVLVLAFAFLQRGNTLAGGVHRVRDHHTRFAATKLVPAAVQVVAGVVYVFVLHLGAAGAVAAAPTGFLVSIVVASLGRGRPRVPFARLPRETARRIMALGLPVVPESLARWAQLLSLRPLLQLTSAVQETARYTFSSAFAQVVSPVTEAFEQYVTPKYYRFCVTGDDAGVAGLRRLTSLFGGIAACGAIVGIALMDPVFRALAPPAYADTAGIAAIGLAGILLRSPMSLMVHNLRTTDRRAALLATVVVGLAASYLQFVVLVGSLGATAAALSIYVYPAVSCLVMTVVLRGGRHRIVDLRDLLVTNAAVLGVLAVMLTTTHDGTSSIDWVVMTTAVLVGGAVVTALVLARHRDVVRAVIGGRPDGRSAA
ncbi:lipopolysaccharide biosynthesis protein [Nocardioides marmoraquaticus]